MDWDKFTYKSDGFYKKLHETHVEYYHFWKSDILFTWRWWVAVSLIVVSWAIWILIRKKESTDRLLYVGSFVMVFSSALDMIGIELNLWTYPINVFPLMPEFIPFDICILPVVTMVFIQYFPDISPYIKAGTYSAASSFIFEPFNQWIGLYKRINWEYYYSVPIMILIYLVSNHIASKNKFAKLK